MKRTTKTRGSDCKSVFGLSRAELATLAAGLHRGFERLPVKIQRLLKKCFREAQTHPRNAAEFGALVIMLVNCFPGARNSLPLRDRKSYDRTGEPWIHEEEVFLTRHYPRIPIEALCLCLGRSTDSIHHKARWLGLRRKQYSGSRSTWSVWTWRQERRLLRLRRERLPFQQIARVMHRSLGSVEAKYHKLMQCRARRKKMRA